MRREHRTSRISMLRTIVALGALASASAFAPMGARPMGLARASAPRAVSARGPRMQVAPSKIEQEVKLTPEIFKQLDVDGGGSIDVGELKAIFGNNSAQGIDTLMKRTNLDGNGELDDAEYEREMNMQEFGHAQGGNLFVHNAIDFDLLKSYSILADGEASILVGKGFDPLNCATNIEILKKYRKAELKHCHLTMLAAAGWPVLELDAAVAGQEWASDRCLSICRLSWFHLERCAFGVLERNRTQTASFQIHI